MERARLNATLESITSLAVLEGCRGSGKTHALRAWLADKPGALFVADAAARDAWVSILEAIAAAPVDPTIVIDRFERAPADLPDRLLALAAERPGVRIVVAGRTAGPLGDQVVRVRNGIVRVPAEELLLTDEEIEGILGLRPALSELEVLRLPLLCLAAAAFVEEEQLSVVVAARRAATGEVADALRGLDDHLIRAIRLMAVPEQLRDDVPAAGFSVRDHRDLLRELVLRGLGVSHDGVFRFAPSWRVALGDDLRESSPDEFRQAHARAAADLTDRDHAVEALGHHLAAGRLEDAAATARDFWFELSLLRPEETLAVLDRAGRASFAKSETLCALVAASAETLGDPRRAEVWWRSAIADASATPSPKRQRRGVQGRAWHAFIRARALRGLGMFEAASVVADEGVDILDPSRLLPSRNSTIGTMLSEFALALVHVGRLNESRTLALTGAALSPTGSPGWYAARSLGAAIEAICGNLVGARQQLEEIEQFLAEPRLAQSPRGAWSSVARAFLLADEGRIAEATSIVTAADLFPSDDVAPVLAASAAFMEVATGSPEVPPVIITPSPGDSVRVSPLVSGQMAWMRAWVALVTGGVAPARIATSGFDSRLVMTGVLRALELRLSQQPAEIVVLLAPLLSDLPGDTTERTRAAALALLAVAALEVDEDSIATTAVKQLEVLERARGTRLPGLLLRESDRALLWSRIPGSQAILERMLLLGVQTGAGAAEIPVLSRAQHRVLRVLVEETSVAKIGARLSLSPNTVKSHLRAIYQKLGVTGREDALIRAARTGLLPWGTDAD